MMTKTQSLSKLCAKPAFRARRLLRAEDGSALIEMGLTIALFAAPLLLGTAEVAQIAYDAAEIEEAATAGALCGMQSPTLAASTTAITAAAQADAPDFGTSLSVTPNTYWVCANNPGGTQYLSKSVATSTCTGSNNGPLEFLQVKTSAVVTLPIHFSQLGATYTIQGVSVQEVEQ
jgi:Flp pilus assembly protein TadG